MEIFTYEGFMALLQVIGIDLVLAGDNAVVIGLAAAGLPKEMRAKAIAVGIAAATVMRIGFALITAQLLAITGLLFIGGLLLVWVCYKMYKELRAGHGTEHVDIDAIADSVTAPKKTFRQAATQIIIADVSMSLDNVLAVAGAAHGHPTVLIVGLALSIALMAFAATYIAKLLNKHSWIAWVGLALIVYVSATMLWQGGQEIYYGKQPVAEAIVAPSTPDAVPAVVAP